MTDHWCPECEEYQGNYVDDDAEQPLRCLECRAALVAPENGNIKS